VGPDPVGHSGTVSCEWEGARQTSSMAHPVLEDLLKLPPAERAELAMALWDSLGDSPELFPLTDAQRTELDQRMAEHGADPSTAVPWEDVLRQLRQE